MEEDIEIRYVWMCLLAVADREGYIDATISSLARRFNVAEDMTRKAIDAFTSPDPLSRTPDNDGKRLEPIRDTYGWKILNYEKYRDIRDEEDRREYMKEYMRKYRKRDKEDDIVNNEMFTESNEKSTLTLLANTDADADADKRKKHPSPPSKIQLREKVYLTQDEIDTLQKRFGQDRLNWMYDKLDYYLSTTKKRYAGCYGFFKKGSWLIDSVEEHFKTAAPKYEDDTELRELEKQFTPEQRAENIKKVANLANRIGRIG